MSSDPNQSRPCLRVATGMIKRYTSTGDRLELSHAFRAFVCFRSIVSHRQHRLAVKSKAEYISLRSEESTEIAHLTGGDSTRPRSRVLATLSVAVTINN
eukprot:6263036-Amphidinium_carterae.1